MAHPARRPRPALIPGLVALAITCLLWAGGVLDWPELVTLDLRFQLRGTQDPGTQIVLVPISRQMNDRMYDLGIYGWPLPRSYYARAMANLRQAGAGAVGLDVLMENQTSDDATLARELGRWHGRAILDFRSAVYAGELLQGTTTVNVQQGTRVSRARYEFLLPGGGLLAPDWPRGAGYVEVTQDLDGVIHGLVPSKRVAGTVVDSFPLALARVVAPKVAVRYAPDSSITLDYAGPPNTFPVAADLDLVANGLFDPHTVTGKIVLIGATDPARKDLFVGPFDHGAARTPGVEVNANALWTLLGRRALRRVSYPLDLAALLGMGMLALWWGLRLRPLLALLATLASITAYIALCQVLFTRGIWLGAAAPLLGSGLVYVAARAARFGESLRELRRVEAIFGRYVSPTVVRQLLGKADALRLGGQRREISVLFSDIRGFTTLSERLPPEEVGAMLNEYFSATVDVIFAHGGTVDKFVGDAIMAVFNAPLDQPDHAERAARTAQAMQEVADGLMAHWAAQGRPALRIGVGVHTGMAVVGSFGAERRSEYTAIGDTVNVAARLESLSKDLGCSIVISAATARLLTTLDPFVPLGLVPIRGREEALELYGVRRAEPAPKEGRQTDEG